MEAERVPSLPRRPTDADIAREAEWIDRTLEQQADMDLMEWLNDINMTAAHLEYIARDDGSPSIPTSVGRYAGYERDDYQKLITELERRNPDIRKRLRLLRGNA